MGNQTLTGVKTFAAKPIFTNDVLIKNLSPQIQLQRSGSITSAPMLGIEHNFDVSSFFWADSLGEIRLPFMEVARKSESSSLPGKINFYSNLNTLIGTLDSAGAANTSTTILTKSKADSLYVSNTDTQDNQFDIPFLVPPSGEYLMTISGAGGISASTLAGAANRFDLYPYIPRANVAINQLVVNCTTAVTDSLGQIVVYNSDTNGRPDTLLLETPNLSFSTTGAKFVDVSLSLQQGKTYWFGIRHSSNPTLSAWASTATPDINGGTTISITGRKILRRTLDFFAFGAPTTWGFVSSEINSAVATAIWMRRA